MALGLKAAFATRPKLIKKIKHSKLNIKLTFKLKILGLEDCYNTLTYMKKLDWFKIISLLFIVVIIDQYTKFWAQSKPESWYGPLHIILVHNHGAMLGLFSDSTAFLRIVALSTSGFFVLSLYFFIQYIIPLPLLKLRYGLSLLVGGILGNVLDRVLYGYVVDFISLDILGFHSPIWNLADMIQWIGYALITYSIIKYGHLLWPDKNSRTQFWSNQNFQIRFTLVYILVGFLMTAISFIFAYTYLRLSLTEIAGLNNPLTDKYISTFIFSFITLIFIFIMTLFVVARKISHHIAGPVYAFERYLTDLLNTENNDFKKFKLRSGDEFLHLEKSAELLKEKIQALKANKL